MAINHLAPLLNPKEITLTDRKGKQRTYFLSEIPATYSREIVAKWTANALPKMGDYDINHEMMMKIMSYIAVPNPDPASAPLRLTTRDLVDNHVPDLKILSLLEKEMAQYNWDFFLGEELSDLKMRFLRIFSTWLTQILTDSFRRSSVQEKLVSTN